MQAWYKCDFGRGSCCRLYVCVWGLAPCTPSVSPSPNGWGKWHPIDRGAVKKIPARHLFEMHCIDLICSEQAAAAYAFISNCRRCGEHLTYRVSRITYGFPVCANKAVWLGILLCGDILIVLLSLSIPWFLPTCRATSILDTCFLVRYFLQRLLVCMHCRCSPDG